MDYIWKYFTEITTRCSKIRISYNCTPATSYHTWRTWTSLLVLIDVDWLELDRMNVLQRNIYQDIIKAVLPFACFWINFESVSLFSGSTLFSIFFVNKFNVEFILPFAMYCLNLFDISAIDDGFCVVFRDGWIVSPSKCNSSNSPFYQSSKRYSNASW